MSYSSKLILVFFLFLMSSACSTRPEQVMRTVETLLDEGYQCLITPTGFDPPGSIFSIDQNNVKDYVTDKSGQLMVKTVPVALGSYSQVKQLNADFVANMMGQFEQIGAPKVTGAYAEEHKLSVQIAAPVMEEISFADDTGPIIDWYRSFVANSPAYDAKKSYYLVRRAILARGVSYKLNDGLIASLGGEAALAQYIQGSTHIKKDSHDVYTLDQDFPQPLRVCVLPQPLVITKAALTGGVETVELKQKASPLKIDRVASSAPKR